MRVLTPADCSKQMQQPPGRFGRQWWQMVANVGKVHLVQHDILWRWLALHAALRNLTFV